MRASSFQRRRACAPSARTALWIGVVSMAIDAAFSFQTRALDLWLHPGPSAAAAQLIEDYRFKGKVVDTAGMPIPKVQVTFRDVETGGRIVFTTKDDGTFDRRMIQHGVYEVSFEKEGYVSRTERFDWSLSPTGTIVKEATIVLENQSVRAKRELGKKAAALYEEAYAALAANDCPTARRKAEELLALGAGDWEYAVRFVLARCYAIQGELGSSVYEYRNVLALKPDLFEARFDLGLVLERQGKAEEALVEYAAAAELHPDDAEVQYNLGAGLFRKQDLERARPHLEKAVALDSLHAQAAKALGFVHIQSQTKDLVAAKRLLQRYLDLEPDAADAAQIRALVQELEASVPGPK